MTNLTENLLVPASCCGGNNSTSCATQSSDVFTDGCSVGHHVDGSYQDISDLNRALGSHSGSRMDTRRNYTWLRSYRDIGNHRCLLHQKEGQKLRLSD